MYYKGLTSKVYQVDRSQEKSHQFDPNTFLSFRLKQR